MSSTEGRRRVLSPLILNLPAASSVTLTGAMNSVRTDSSEQKTGLILLGINHLAPGQQTTLATPLFASIPLKTLPVTAEYIDRFHRRIE
jgi:hypothetical protein